MSENKKTHLVRNGILLSALVVVSFIIGSLIFIFVFRDTLGEESSYSPEQAVWIEEYWIQGMFRASKEYPVESVRLQIEEAAERIGEDYLLNMSSTDHISTVIESSQNINAQAFWDVAANMPSIVFYVPALMRMQKEAESLGMSEGFEDVLIVMYLHELYHIDHHTTATDAEGNLPYDVRLEQESQAWWDSAEHVLEPMRRGGRLNIPEGSPFFQALLNFKSANGDRTDQAWLEFMEYVTPKE